MSDEIKKMQLDFAQLIRLALTEQPEDVRLFVARLVRKYRNTDPELAEQMDLYLRAKAPRSNTIMRKITQSTMPIPALPIDDESRLSLLKFFKDEVDDATVNGETIDFLPSLKCMVSTPLRTKDEYQ